MRISDWSSDVCSSDLTQAMREVGASGNATGRPIAHQPYSDASAASSKASHARGSRRTTGAASDDMRQTVDGDESACQLSRARRAFTRSTQAAANVPLHCRQIESRSTHACFHLPPDGTRGRPDADWKSKSLNSRH